MKEIIENRGSNDKHPAIRLIRNVVFWFESSAVAPAVVIKKIRYLQNSCKTTFDVRVDSSFFEPGLEWLFVVSARAESSRLLGGHLKGRSTTCRTCE